MVFLKRKDSMKLNTITDIKKEASKMFISGKMTDKLLIIFIELAYSQGRLDYADKVVKSLENN